MSTIPVPTTPDAAEPPLICSARGCRRPADWALRWQNPRLHAADRRKTWLACAEHRGSLSDFLTVRGFLREVEPVSARSERQESADGPSR